MPSSFAALKLPQIAAAGSDFVRNIAAAEALAECKVANAYQQREALASNAKEIIMENKFLAMTALAAVLGAPMAAQAQGVTVGVAPSSEIVVAAPVGVDADGGITVEQRPAFREYIVRERVPTYTIQQGVIVGGTLPEEGITTYDVPQKFGTTPYRYTVVNGQTVLVEPRSRRIVQVID